MAITAQFALYPLGGGRIGPTLDAALEQARRAGVAIEVGRVSSTMQGGEEEVFSALRAAFAVAAARGDAVLVATVSNAC
jgi:uncharacterized protein YqgV (UPF0045/DUF77 family)